MELEGIEEKLQNIDFDIEYKNEVVQFEFLQRELDTDTLSRTKKIINHVHEIEEEKISHGYTVCE